MAETGTQTAKLLAPKRGGDHPVYGSFMGGTALDKNNKAVGKLSFATQRCNTKGLSSIEQNLLKPQSVCEPLALYTQRIGDGSRRGGFIDVNQILN